MSEILQREIGDLRLSRVVELIWQTPAREFFQTTSDQDWINNQDWLAAEGAYAPESGNLIMPMQSYVVRTRHHTILVDTCIGNHKDNSDDSTWHMKTDAHYMNNLAALGLRCEDVDFVMCTHFHSDHVGWNTKLVDGRWVPTFPNAKYLISEKELSACKNDDETPARPIIESILPVVESGQAELVSSDYVLDDQVWLEPTPGHTADHFAVRLASVDQHAVIGGDLMHSPVQCRHPEWHANSDWNPELACETRVNFMGHYSELNALVCMMHFPLPSAGRFMHRGEAYQFKYDKVDW